MEASQRVKTYIFERVTRQEYRLMRKRQASVSDARFIRSVSLRDGAVIELYDQLPQRPKRPMHTPTTVNCPYGKSILQKAIRRNLPLYAVDVAHTIWKFNPVELLRRLPIIIVEDAIVHPGLLGVIWLMMVGQIPSYQYTQEDMWQVLSVVRDAALISARDHFDKQPDEGDIPVEYDNAHMSACASIGAALMIRHSYGGTTADMGMTLFAARRWYSRANDRLWEAFVKCVVISDPGEMPPTLNRWENLPSELLEAGADFHCFPAMLNPFSKVDRMREYVFQFKSGLQAKRLLTLRGSSIEDQKSAAKTFALGDRTLDMGKTVTGPHLRPHNPTHDLDEREWIKHAPHWNRLAASCVEWNPLETVINVKRIEPDIATMLRPKKKYVSYKTPKEHTSAASKQ